VYALYSDYGYSQKDIAILFVAGFGSSMVFGSFVGGMADWGGRRNFAILYAITYALSCFTKHFRHFGILMIGRLLGGVATSLLFSVFEAWLIRAHSDKSCKQYLSNTLSWAAYGNSIIAILAGLVADNAASNSIMKRLFGEVYLGGYLIPFDISMITLIICGYMAYTLWEENYGESKHTERKDQDAVDAATAKAATSSSSAPGSAPSSGGLDLSSAEALTESITTTLESSKWYAGLKNALNVTLRSRDILLCGIVSSIFEGSMYIFVFMWTPSLREAYENDGRDADLPFGVIFSTFMVCCMAGSTLFGCLVEGGKFKFINNGLPMKIEELAMYEFAAAAISMLIISLSGNYSTIKFIFMNVFEIIVGMYWPTMGTLKGSIVPEDKRAAIYNLYRIPLNFIVLFSLLKNWTPTTSFTINAILLSIATFCQYNLLQSRMKFGSTGSGNNNPVASASKDVENAPLVKTDAGGDEDGMTDIKV